MLLGLVLGDRFFFFYKYCIRKKIACFLPQSVSSFIVGRHQLAKRNFRYFFPCEFSWKKAALGFAEVLLFQKALLASGSIWATWQPAFMFLLKNMDALLLQCDSSPARTSSEGLTATLPWFLSFAAIDSWGPPALESQVLHFLMLRIWYLLVSGMKLHLTLRKQR